MPSYHDRIKRQFGRSAQERYDRNARIQLSMAAMLSERTYEQYFRCNHPAPHRVLEIGCGTGTLTALLARMPILQNSCITAIDISASMLAEASRKLSTACPDAISRIHWIEGDAEQWAADQVCNVHLDNRQTRYAPYDLVLSNACFQWFVQPARTLAALHETISQGGLLAFTTFGPRTMHELHTSFRHAYERLHLSYRHHGLTFLPLSSWQNMLQEAGFRLVDAVSLEQVERHRSVPAFLHTVKAIGASVSSAEVNSFTSKVSTMRKLFHEMYRVYESLFPASCGTGITATYETLMLVAVKDGGVQQAVSTIN
ncbi:methyltransferase domain-containing protein [Paenibacillus xylaniclasticus]|uniref:methyltransferase domain-containing protein n=1 Tax=Paenibacillus xylaniclasticus TaxID=588083 RepID=UPI0013E0AB21|nr:MULTISPECIES: methyltransferase domain-containing protein [Paenibacillus]GFN32094.1 malonyl-[acyl-carrier protein] O-methyltransferase [Paenibacillus curdlanolyticus]